MWQLNWKHIFLTKGKSLFSLWSHCGLRTARTDVRPCRRPGLHWWRLGAPRAGTSNKHYCYFQLLHLQLLHLQQTLLLLHYCTTALLAGTSNKHYCYCNPAPHIKHTFNTNAQLLPTLNSANFDTSVISSGWTIQFPYKMRDRQTLKT